MSWLTDIAGKAENFLNKLDSEAASALTKSSKKHSILLPHERQFEQHTEQHISSAPRTPQHIPDRSSKSWMASSVSVPGDLNAYFRSSPTAATAASGAATSTSLFKKTVASAAATPAHTRNASLEHTIDFSIDSDYNESQTQVVSSDGSSSSATEHSGQHSRQSSVSSLASYPPLLMPSAATDFTGAESTADASAYTALRLETGSSSSTTSSGCSAQLATYVTVDTQDLPSYSAAPQGSMSQSTEIEMLRREVSCLNQEIKQLVNRSTASQTELRTLRSSQSSGSGQLAGAQKKLSELQLREVDLQECLHAKDSQVAVLRVRLQELDDELLDKNTLLQQCQLENTRLCEGASVSSSRHSDALENAQGFLSQAESALKQEQQQHRASQENFNARVRELETQREAFVAQVKEAHNKLQAEAARERAHQAQVASLRAEVSSVREELENYKTKARHILHSKEQLIVSLKRGRTDHGGGEEGADLLMSELTQAREELELSREEVCRSSEDVCRARAELAELQTVSEQEQESHSALARELEEQLTENRKVREDVELEARHAKEELRCLQEELSRHKVLLESKLQDKDQRITTLQTQLHERTAAAAAGGGSVEEELHRRVRGLTEALLQKQGAIENLNTELQARTMQLNRTQQQYQDTQQLLNREPALMMHTNDDVRSRVLTLLVESPFDGGVTRRVKRAYGSLDRLSVGLGLFLRRYPIARIIVLLYMVLLHLWVIAVLLTYTPEMHSADYQMVPPLPPLPDQR